jgi:hypothetical protein
MQRLSIAHYSFLLLPSHFWEGRQGGEGFLSFAPPVPVQESPPPLTPPPEGVRERIKAKIKSKILDRQRPHDIDDLLFLDRITHRLDQSEGFQRQPVAVDGVHLWTGFSVQPMKKTIVGQLE